MLSVPTYPDVPQVRLSRLNRCHPPKPRRTLLPVLRMKSPRHSALFFRGCSGPDSPAIIRARARYKWPATMDFEGAQSVR